MLCVCFINKGRVSSACQLGLSQEVAPEKMTMEPVEEEGGQRSLGKSMVGEGCSAAAG